MEGRLVPARRQCEVEVTWTSYRIDFGGSEVERREREIGRRRRQRKTKEEVEK